MAGLFLIPGRGERIRTSGPYVPNVVLYQAELHPEGREVYGNFALEFNNGLAPLFPGPSDRLARRHRRQQVSVESVPSAAMDVFRPFTKYCMVRQSSSFNAAAEFAVACIRTWPPAFCDKVIE